MPLPLCVSRFLPVLFYQADRNRLEKKIDGFLKEADTKSENIPSHTCLALLRLMRDMTIQGKLLPTHITG